MYENLLRIFDAMQENEVEHPLIETLKLIDILSKRAVSQIDISLSNGDIDPSSLAQKRKQGIPLEYIVGMAPFLGKMFYCSKDTLIPRQETELLANVALNYVKAKQEHSSRLTLIDMGTGCGNIAISLVLNSENTVVLASDLNPETVEITSRNVEKFNVKDRIEIFHGDLFAPISGKGYEGKIDIVVCNPPYIPTASLKKMDSQIIDHEPREAFEAGPFGIDFYKRLINDSLTFLMPDGILVFEIGAGQDKLVTRLLEKKEGYHSIRYFDDGKEIRVISARKKIP